MKKSVMIGLGIALVLVAIVLVFSFKIFEKPNTEDSGASLKVPAPGFENIDEMIVNEDSGSCPEILTLETPVDISLVTSILYPGQVRGGDYKPHGGFRFDDNTDNKVSVKIPIDSHITRGSRYMENGQVQHLFEFENDCKVSYRFDHLLVLSDKLQAIANTLPEAREGHSETTNLGNMGFDKGEEIAVEVGIPGNVFVDFGVYDYRKENEASKTSELIKQYPSDLASHGVCWLNWLSPEDAEIAKSLPGADGQSGKQSDYC